MLNRFISYCASEYKIFILVLNSWRFYIRNKRLWNELGSHNVGKKSVVISEAALGYDYWSLIVSITSSIVASGLRSRVVFLMKGVPPKNRVANRIQKSFCSCEFVYLGVMFERNKLFIKDEALKIFSKIKKPDDVLDIKYRNIAIGEQVYDSVLKLKHASLWKIDDKVLTQIEYAINCIDCILDISNTHQVVAGMFTHTTGVYHGVAARTILHMGKPVFLGLGGMNSLYRYNSTLSNRGHLDIHIKIPTSLFEKIYANGKESLNVLADLYFKKRFGGDINDWDAMRAFSSDKKLYKSKAEFFEDYSGLGKDKKNVFIMLHAMNDDPHVQIQHFFKDYYDWFVTTLKFARKNKSVNWVFKQHPMIKFYPDDANLLGLFDLIKDDDHIIYIDEHVPFNQASVPMVADAIVTCAGTAGLEFSAMGIPAIITAGNSYSGYGICYEPKTLEEYFVLLENVGELEQIEGDKKERAKILFYLIYSKLIPGFFTGFLPYMNHDQIKELSASQALSLYLKSFEEDFTPQVEAMKRFIRGSGNDEKAELLLEI